MGLSEEAKKVLNTELERLKIERKRQQEQVIKIRTQLKKEEELLKWYSDKVGQLDSLVDDTPEDEKFY